MESFKRTGSKRVIRGVEAKGNASDAVGKIFRDCEIFGFSKGQFSLIDLIEELLAQTGPADVTISTWTAASREIDCAYRLLAGGSIKHLRFLVDFSFQSRQPEYCNALRARFGDDSIRVTRTHAKFVIIRNDEWNLVVRTSMNLNQNPRLENFEVSDSSGMADFVEGMVDNIFEDCEPEETFTKPPSHHKKSFEQQEFGAIQATDNGLSDLFTKPI